MQTLRHTGPSMASITSRIEAAAPCGVMWNPPVCPRCELMNPARVSDCRTFERKLCGAPVARASSGSETRRLAERAHKLDHHAHAVIGGTCQLHGRIRSLHGVILPNKFTERERSSMPVARLRVAGPGSSVLFIAA